MRRAPRLVVALLVVTTGAALAAATAWSAPGKLTLGDLTYMHQEDATGNNDLLKEVPLLSKLPTACTDVKSHPEAEAAFQEALASVSQGIQSGMIAPWNLALASANKAKVAKAGAYTGANRGSFTEGITHFILYIQLEIASGKDLQRLVKATDGSCTLNFQNVENKIDEYHKEANNAITLLAEASGTRPPAMT